jgi:hypothetical protein
MSVRNHSFIACMSRGKTAELRVSITTRGARPAVDFRIWWKPAGDDEFMATRKGASFDMEEVPELIEALQEAIRLQGDAGLQREEAGD